MIVSSEYIGLITVPVDYRQDKYLHAFSSYLSVFCVVYSMTEDIFSQLLVIFY